MSNDRFMICTHDCFNTIVDCAFVKHKVTHGCRSQCERFFWYKPVKKEKTTRGGYLYNAVSIDHFYSLSRCGARQITIANILKREIPRSELCILPMWCDPNIVHETVLQLSWDQGEKQVPYIKWITASSLMWYYSFLEIMNDEY